MPETCQIIYITRSFISLCWWMDEEKNGDLLPSDNARSIPLVISPLVASGVFRCFGDL